MSDAAPANGHTRTLKERARDEVRQFVQIFLYLLVTFSGYTIYGALLEEGTGEHYVAFSFAIVEALIGAKVMLVTENWTIYTRYEDRPLIYPTLFKSVLFLGLMIYASLMEKVVDALVHHRSVMGTLFDGTHLTVLVAKDLMIFLGLIPFFALREFGRIRGRWVLARMFFDPGPVGEKLRAQAEESEEASEVRSAARQGELDA